ASRRAKADPGTRFRQGRHAPGSRPAAAGVASEIHLSPASIELQPMNAWPPTPRSRASLLASIVIASALVPPVVFCAARPASAGEPASRLRRPVALAFVQGGKFVLVANQRSGSVSIVDAAAQKVVAEHIVAGSLADLVCLSDGRHLLAVDPSADELLLLDFQD